MSGAAPVAVSLYCPRNLLQMGGSLPRQRQAPPPPLAPALGAQVTPASDLDGALQALSPKKAQRPLQTQ